MEKYTTGDLHIAALLLISDAVEYEGTLQEKDGRIVFSFLDAATCKRIVARYMSGTLMVNAKKYADAFKSVKDMLFEEKKLTERKP